MTLAAFPVRPRTAGTQSDVPPSVVPALAALARCDTGVDAMSTLIQIPDNLLALITYHAAARSYIKPPVVRSLIQLTGVHRLNATLGAKVTKNLVARFMN